MTVHPIHRSNEETYSQYGVGLDLLGPPVKSAEQRRTPVSGGTGETLGENWISLAFKIRIFVTNLKNIFVSNCQKYLSQIAKSAEQRSPVSGDIGKPP